MGFWNRIKSASQNTNTINRKTEVEVVSDLIRSIKKNIELVLNSKEGCTLCAPDFGLKDFNDATATTRSLSQTIISDIRVSLERYEPRVRITRIEYIPDAYDVLQLNFRITCVVLLKQKNELTELNIILDSSNKKFRVV
ncbi:type VI secretion system baseplate subunit TssE [Actinobacillus equuli]|uniref:type VI secretion system baseplate subunit TssE n=1 Tax=Actinobacillus equuli TaxID=718 RepID=UPI00244321A7|nr:type VI secretion system baseplate subunit TssE [Actinobacillus equuli]WGE59955.1 type VI secretion system baseplate subunit TssE [Actinobacillus equuli subsp. haemolyticus]WGE61399.1 type VI secretion system baseplate subunit TssE [Actinobacillus equuli subsp. haemolyticus]WGE74222.1 type VI secretion system baseplate subunit TssE [Actinobacillus equuli subsp. haemolyticus]WGE76031.1 type VI secretion system baseplate subunit TssE [Actinobacillus equuli subsp. haemolyticus]WGE78097.1 type 